MHRLARPDAEENAQNLEIGDLLRQGGIEAAAALLDESKVESGGKGDCLQVMGNTLGVVAADFAVFCVGVGSRYRGVFLYGQARHGLNEGRIGIEVRVRDAAIARPETGIDRQLREVGEALDLSGAIGRAAGKDGE